MIPSERKATISLMLNVGGTEKQKFEMFKNEFTRNMITMMGKKEGTEVANEVLATITEEEYISVIRSAFETASDKYIEFFKKMYEMDKEGTELYSVESTKILQDMSKRIEEMMRKKVIELSGFSPEDINGTLEEEPEEQTKDPRETWGHFKNKQ